MLRRSRGVGLAIAVTLVGLLLGSWFAAFAAGGAHATPDEPLRATTAAPPHGAMELAKAQASLHDLARAAGHPHAGAPGVSPGEFTWSNLTAGLTASPSAREGPALAWDPVDGYVLLFGGIRSGPTFLSDTWSFSNGAWSNLTGSVSGSPPPSVLDTLAYDPSDHEMILFGGELATGMISAQTWAYSGGTWTNLTGRTGATPPPTVFSGMTTDTTDSEVVLFGGALNGSVPFLADTWTFKSGTWTNITASANAPAGTLEFPQATDDPATGGVTLLSWYGVGSGFAQYTLSFTGGSWHNLSGSVTGDAGRLVLGGGGYLAPLGAAAYVSSLYLNSSGGELFGAHTVEFANSTWTNVTGLVGGPPLIGEIGAVSDLPGDQGLIAFGGVAPGGYEGTTWVLTAPPEVQLHVAHAVTDPAVSDAFSASVTGGIGAYSYHWSFGDGGTSTSAGGAHAYARAGQYGANLTVVDGVGHSVTQSLIVTVNPAPTASASATPSPATAGSEVALVGTFGGGTGPYTFAWSLGDVNTSAASSLGHVYAKAGNYSVSFTVTDALGQTATQTFTLSVKAAASSSSSSSSSVSLSSGTGLYLLLGIVLLAVVALVLGVLLARRPRSPPGPPPPYSPPPAAGGWSPPAPPPPGAPPPP